MESLYETNKQTSNKLNVMHGGDCMSRNRRRRGRNSLLGARAVIASVIASMIPRSQAQLNQAASDEDMSTTSKFRGRSSVEDARQEGDGGAGKRYDSKTSLHGLDWFFPPCWCRTP